MKARRNPVATSILVVLMIVCAVSITGCGVTKVASDTVDYVGDMFASKGDSLRKRLVVLPFKSGVKDLEAKAAELNQAMLENLGRSASISLVDPQLLMDEAKQAPAPLTQPEQRLVWAARRLGVNVVLRGQITDLSVYHALTGIYGMRENTPFLGLEVDLALLDVTTGALLDVESFRESEELDFVAAQGIQVGAKPDPKLVDKLTKELVKPCLEWVGDVLSDHKWGGTVLAVEGNRLLVTVARDTGLGKNSTLIVQALGEQIKTGSGLMVHLPGEVVGKARLVEIGENNSWAEIIPREEPTPKEEAKEAAEAKEAGDGKEVKEGETKKAEKKKEIKKPLEFSPGQVVRAY